MKVSGVHVFEKLDGSNLRFEWTKKKGWSKFGTRRRLFDETDLVFGGAIELFLNTLADDLERVIREEGYKHVVAFAEFWGDGSFAGNHLDEEHRLSLFDIVADKKGILPPNEYLKKVYDRVGDNKAEYLGQHNWNEDLVRRVEEGTFEGQTFEGVVGKYKDKSRVVLLKAKSSSWKAKVTSAFGDKAKAILDS